MGYNEDIEAAVAFLKSSNTIDYSKTTRDFKVNHITLHRRYLGISASKQEGHTYSSRKLSLEQEKTLINNIIKLTNRGTPPTAYIIKNFAEEMIQEPLGKQWTTRFIRHHQNSLKSIYLHSMDHARQKAEYKPHFAEFYQLVGLKWAHYDPFVYFFN